MQRVLVVDDDRSITEVIRELLTQVDIAVDVALTGEAALELFDKNTYELVILDIMMPGKSGFEVCEELRRTTSVPILFLSAKDTENDKVEGLSLGADDYVVKPFSPREFVARVKARLRRPQSVNDFAQVLESGDITIHLKQHKATLFGEELRLTPKEYDLLVLLISKEGEVVSSRELFETLWDFEFDDSAANTIMVHIRRLRSKLHAKDHTHEYIKTIWGVGYTFNAHAK